MKAVKSLQKKNNEEFSSLLDELNRLDEEMLIDKIFILLKAENKEDFYRPYTKKYTYNGKKRYNGEDRY